MEGASPDGEQRWLEATWLPPDFGLASWGDPLVAGPKRNISLGFAGHEAPGEESAAARYVHRDGAVVGMILVRVLGRPSDAALNPEIKHVESDGNGRSHVRAVLGGATVVAVATGISQDDLRQTVQSLQLLAPE